MSSDAEYLEVARSVLSTEANALLLMADQLGDDFARAVERLLSLEGRVICVGVGKSGHVARKVAATFASTGTAAYFVHPTEASHGDLGAIHKQDVVLALSRSGETGELDDIIQYTKRFEVGLIAITAMRESTLGRAADIVLQIPDAPEACAEVRAPTTSTTLSMALGDALAIALLRRRGFDANSFKMFHPGGKLGALLKTAGDLMLRDEAVPKIAERATLRDALQELSSKNLGCVAVVAEEERLIGFLTDGDLRRVAVSGEAPQELEAVMTRNPIAVSPSELAGSILQIMNQKKITQMPVVEEGRLVGLVHMHDLLRAGLV